MLRGSETVDPVVCLIVTTPSGPLLPQSEAPPCAGRLCALRRRLGFHTAPCPLRMATIRRRVKMCGCWQRTHAHMTLHLPCPPPLSASLQASNVPESHSPEVERVGLPAITDAGVLEDLLSNWRVAVGPLQYLAAQACNLGLVSWFRHKRPAARHLLLGPHSVCSNDNQAPSRR